MIKKSVILVAVVGILLHIGCGDDGDDSPCDKVLITTRGDSVSVSCSESESARKFNFDYDNTGRPIGFDFVCGPHSGHVWFGYRGRVHDIEKASVRYEINGVYCGEYYY